jgi:glycosyltransferase involved in cell wall biosynthesis
VTEPTRRGLPAQVLLVVEQLRRRVPGGSGTYIEGVLNGLVRLWGGNPSGTASGDPSGDASGNPRGDEEADLGLTLYASRAARRAKPDQLVRFGFPVLTAPVPGSVLTRAWDRGLARVPGGFSVVHGFSLAVPREKGIRTIVTVHDLAWRSIPEAYPRHGRKWHEMAFVRSVDAGDEFVVPSESVAAEVRSAGADEMKVVLIEPGSDHLPEPDGSSASAARMLESAGVGGRFVLSVGTLEPRKNLSGLIEAFGKVRGSLPGEWSLVVVGPEGWGPGVEAREGVVLLGSVSPGDLSALYAKAAMLAYVPFIEGYGLPPLEAMRAGTPVVSSRIPSIGEAAFVVDPESCDSIAGGLLAVASDGDLRERLVRLGLDRAGALTWENCAAAHVDLWRREAGRG